MKYLSNKFFSVLMFFSLSNVLCFSQNDSLPIKQILKRTEISGNCYFAYTYNITDNLNSFALKRGYITFKSKLSSKFSVRYTQDITLDTEGSDAGNVEVRMKYLYIKFRVFDTGILKNSFFEAGLAHRPIVPFEEEINAYRSQGKMFLEKSGIVNTADFGISFAGLLGGKLSPEALQKTGKHFPGKYGSFALGIYNGGGYHKFEYNNNKTLEGRLSLRFLPQSLPGLQISYGGIYGKGNVGENADFVMNTGILSFENIHYVLVAQVYKGRGDYQGKYFDTFGYAAKNEGYSVFGEFKIPKTSFAFFGRYDNFISYRTTDYKKTTYIGGIAYRFLKNKLFAYYETNLISGQKTDFFEVVLDVVF